MRTRLSLSVFSLSILPRPRSGGMTSSDWQFKRKDGAYVAQPFALGSARCLCPLGRESHSAGPPSCLRLGG